MLLAYADPPYPGRAHLYADHHDYAGEVNHNDLIERIVMYDGWALSTSAEALPDVLDIVRRHETRRLRILAWVKHTITVSWEPVIVVPARTPQGVRDWIEVEPDAYQWRDKPDGAVIGQKPKPFCRWLFEWLGARPEDEFHDFFPGSGQVMQTWIEWCEQPGLPLYLSPTAQKRADRRERARDPQPELPLG